MAMRLTIGLFRSAGGVCLVVITAFADCLNAADKIVTTLFVKDSLAVFGRPATVEARLSTTGLLTAMGLGGEPIELLVDGKVVATGMTGGDGRVLLSYSSKKQGIIPIYVRVGGSSRVLPAEGRANLAVWEQRNPVVAIELAALMEEPPAPRSFLPIGGAMIWTQKPMPDAADELTKLTQFYYRVIYVVFLPSPEADGFRANTEAREWLIAHKFPPGYIVALPPGGRALGEKLDELRAAGWKTIRTGLGRSNEFAEAFLQRRLEAVIVPEPAQGAVPSKAKVARAWKDVRKRL